MGYEETGELSAYPEFLRAFEILPHHRVTEDQLWMSPAATAKPLGGVTLWRLCMKHTPCTGRPGMAFYHIPSILSVEKALVNFQESSGGLCEEETT